MNLRSRIRFCLAVISFLALIAFPGAVLGDVISPRIVGSVSTPGNACDVYVSGSYAYVTRGFCPYELDGGGGLTVIDVSNPARPRIIGSVEMPDPAKDVYVSGSYAYVIEPERGLQVIDVSNPASPRIVGSVYTCYAYGGHVNGGYAYVADFFCGLRVIDVSNPASPNIVGSVDDVWAGYGAFNVYVSGGYAYVVSILSLDVIDVSNPASPQSVGTTGMMIDTLPWLSGDVYVIGSYAYLAAGESGLKVIDVSNPTSPNIVGSVNTYYANEVYASDRYAYVADSTDGLQIVDVSNPASPVIVRTVDTPGGTPSIYGLGGGASGVCVIGPYAYVADGDSGLQIIDLGSYWGGSVSWNLYGMNTTCAACTGKIYVDDTYCGMDTHYSYVNEYSGSYTGQHTITVYKECGGIETQVGSAVVNPSAGQNVCVTFNSCDSADIEVR